MAHRHNEWVARVLGFPSARALKRAHEATADGLVAKYQREGMDRLQTVLIALHYAHGHASSSIAEVLRMRAERMLARKGFKPPRHVVRVKPLPTKGTER